MQDGADAVLGHERVEETRVAHVAHDRRHSGGDRPIEAGRQIVQHDHPLAGIDELVRHLASDIAGAAGDEDGHAFCRPDRVAGRLA